ncbi:penicillin-binding protein 2 [Xinfangfangia sp. CPCC 101601]|uniref:Penicillin-binding protein 2 n=1 Tax=Pseudogemmobacter lacusdianii TaxID=3069608 RepID=A0ABU0VTG1_9RHOB|nr:penicillin-binding protein 2 [Xinfangfangia sp. CPCC 101601]MDQ2065017.1 penicillin-binding protein 2 [Xinfangfangia sp. CPCC 101601]
MRTPLRPLARVLRARADGSNPDLIERENIHNRQQAMQERTHSRAAARLGLMAACFASFFVLIGVRMGHLANTEPMEPVASAPGAEIVAQRADIVDRNGRLLATNMTTHALYAHPHDMVDPKGTAQALAEIFPDLKADALERRFTDGRRFVWIRKVMSPEQMQLVHDIGDPGLLFGPREMRLYPNGNLLAHVLGGYSFGAEGVHSAEVIGTAGIEKAMDARLRDPAQGGEPLQLSIDLTVQATVEEVLQAGITALDAKGGAAIIMDVYSGEVIALASAPTFDPNNRPVPLIGKNDEASDSPLFNRAVQGVYELGSTFKIFAAAQAMELGLVNPDTLVDANAPMVWGKHRIKEFEGKNYGPLLTVTDVIGKSSNVGTASIALMIGGVRQQAFFKSLGLFDPLPIELVEAPGAKPLIPKKWPDIVTITASYGHGMSASPMHLAAAYAAIGNGGIYVKPTLIKQTAAAKGTRVLSEKVARDSVDMLRGVVTTGTASLAEVPGYEVGGKTGTADKPKRTGGYYKDKVINTFASVFPASAPRYVVLVTLDEPVDSTGPKPKRTAGWTAVPVTAEIIRRTAPLMGLRPKVELAQETTLTASSN